MKVIHMYIVGAILLGAAIGGVLGGTFGFWGIMASVPIGIFLGHMGARCQIESMK